MITKRVFDVVASTVGLVLLSPLMALIALAIKIDSRGPVLFRHKRVGLGFQEFRVLKFRTMRNDAEGPQVTFDGDRRITRVGRVLRKSKLDELPQLVNVVRGEMSLVGPRPEVAEWVMAHRKHYERILSVRPGITDPASIEYRREDRILAQASDPERVYAEEILPHKLELSAAYAECRTLRGDIRIILRTIMGAKHETT